MDNLADIAEPRVTQFEETIEKVNICSQFIQCQCSKIHSNESIFSKSWPK